VPTALAVARESGKHRYTFGTMNAQIERGSPPCPRHTGWLNFTFAGEQPQWLAHFEKFLSEIDYAEGPQVSIEYRWAEGQYKRLPELWFPCAFPTAGAFCVTVSMRGQMVCPYLVP
jgi:hypothetical protein